MSKGTDQWAGRESSRNHTSWRAKKRKEIKDSLRDMPAGPDGKESTCNARDPVSIPVSGRSPGKGNGYLIQHSCLKNSMDKSLVGCSSWGSQSLAGHNWATFTFYKIHAGQHPMY